ncbi:DUF4142 domain-containing protein [Pseudoxanthomonas sp. SGNA-20]|jgi:Predicted outer membrane protein|uniref:Putative membrane protein n=1 Tax=Pseudoxanthomonas taiwanensis J19 TaxID=935569 RepID=A0A562D6G4_9GAMM|nr:MULTISPECIES: DUF4142 domain-containing protein [Pseudoxanthomonas]RRN55767.1 DUF4142 domain-containing protein [Pseudoxanthomonas sp. SGNA-20]TWH05130.1 putative membrane protein [Pseudoxanthomonas taiwanensis J19]
MNIKRIATPALLALAIAGLAACGDRNRDGEMDPGVPDTSAADPAAQPPGATVDPAMGDDQATSPAEASALGVLNAINEHEIAAGEQALAKGVTGATADYARLMIDQHTQNRTQTSALGPDEQSQDAQAQRQKGEQERDTLDDLDGEAYRKAYVDAMVKGHTEALEALDQKLIPAAEREEVRQHLSLTRDHVAQHLEQARALQSGTAGQ